MIRGELDNKPMPVLAFDWRLYVTQHKVWYSGFAEKLGLHDMYMQHWQVTSPVDYCPVVGEYAVLLTGVHPDRSALSEIRHRIRDSGGYFNEYRLFTDRYEWFAFLRRTRRIVRAFTPDRTDVRSSAGLEHLASFRDLKDTMRLSNGH